MQTVKGKYIWIIGAGSGIGAALARRLHQHGARLALSARTADNLQRLNEELGSAHQVHPLDISDEASLSAGFEQLMDVWPRVDSIVLLSALYEPMALKNLHTGIAAKVMRVNVDGVFNLIAVTLPFLQQQGNGQVVIASSVAGFAGLPYGQPYSASKAAVTSIAESWKCEWPDLDIKVVHPGFVKTPLTDKNNFAMPMMISAEAAARYLERGMRRKAFEIHFPKRFTWLMKLLRSLPYSLYFRIMKRKGN